MLIILFQPLILKVILMQFKEGYVPQILVDFIITVRKVLLG